MPSDARVWWSKCVVAALNPEVGSTKGSSTPAVQVDVASSCPIPSADQNKLGAFDISFESRRAIENNTLSRHVRSELM